MEKRVEELSVLIWLEDEYFLFEVVILYLLMNE